jgi:hypothetical protein
MTHAMPHAELMSITVSVPPRAASLVQEAAAGRAEQAPRQRAHQRRDVVRQRHELLERWRPGTLVRDRIQAITKPTTIATHGGASRHQHVL